ncbi:MAG TPA: hypothetical protein VM689_11200 [Aliidongia sp.]|nr:hypothetical protein [Aliidongia sp.]
MSYALPSLLPLAARHLPDFRAQVMLFDTLQILLDGAVSGSLLSAVPQLLMLVVRNWSEASRAAV